jgi:hypothetical protein
MMLRAPTTVPIGPAPTVQTTPIGDPRQALSQLLQSGAMNPGDDPFILDPIAMANFVAMFPQLSPEQAIAVLCSLTAAQRAQAARSIETAWGISSADVLAICEPSSPPPPALPPPPTPSAPPPTEDTTTDKAIRFAKSPIGLVAILAGGAAVLYVATR